MSVRSLMKAEKARRAALKVKSDVQTAEEHDVQVQSDVPTYSEFTERTSEVSNAVGETNANALPSDFFDSSERPTLTDYKPTDLHVSIEEIEKDDQFTYKYDSHLVVEDTVPSLETVLRECDTSQNALNDGGVFMENNESETHKVTLFKYCNDDEEINDIIDAAVYGDLDTAFHSELQHESEEQQKKISKELAERSGTEEELMIKGQIPIGFFDGETGQQHKQSKEISLTSTLKPLTHLEERLLELTRDAVEQKQMTESFDEVMAQQRQYNDKLRQTFEHAKNKRCLRVNDSEHETKELADEIEDIEDTFLDKFDWKSKRVRHIN